MAVNEGILERIIALEKAVAVISEQAVTVKDIVEVSKEWSDEAREASAEARASSGGLSVTEVEQGFKDYVSRKMPRVKFESVSFQSNPKGGIDYKVKGFYDSKTGSQETAKDIVGTLVDEDGKWKDVTSGGALRFGNTPVAAIFGDIGVRSLIGK